MKKTIAYLIIIIALFLGIITNLNAQDPNNPTKVLCMGDSRVGTGDIMNWFRPYPKSYPAELQKLLGDGYDVRQFGQGGTAVTLGHPRAIWTSKNGQRSDIFQNAINVQTFESIFEQAFPGQDFAIAKWIAIINYGTNDASNTTWQQSKPNFQNSYITFINMFKGEKIIALPQPTFGVGEQYIKNSNIVELLSIVKSISDETGAKITDFNTEVIERMASVDGLHFPPEEGGNKLFAKRAYQTIKGGVPPK